MPAYIVLSSYLERSIWGEGETVTLQVRVTPAVTSPWNRLQWQWLKDGVPINRTDQPRLTFTDRTDGNSFLIQLKVGDALDSDTGVYSCRVLSTLGTRTISFNLITILGIRVTSIGYPTDANFFVGLELDLTCQVSLSRNVPQNMISSMEDGIPQDVLISVEAEWSRQGGLVLGSQNHMSVSDTTRFNRSVPTYRSTISFSPLMAGDGGDYVCTATCQLSSGLELMVNHSRTLLVDSKSCCVWYVS